MCDVYAAVFYSDVLLFAQNMVLQHGARIGFFRGDVKKLTDDIQALKPNIFPTVPRLLNRIYDRVRAWCAAASS